ncbi:sulfite exporter TauE/SafE family protein 4 [Canna indica]|uniref:Sulfite exporter TauE/SafE family protein 4 n=1 Tax=Canna indica TaxID=4628 RepID=A0AAQ3Q8N5_9LILI|nr:sulfite exporter TauE/SafE family protein 4 [Canna indica]
MESRIGRSPCSWKVFVSGPVKKLEANWRSALATAIGFLGSAFGTAGGVGGGGMFVPMLNLIVGFDTKAAAALSKCMNNITNFSTQFKKFPSSSSRDIELGLPCSSSSGMIMGASASSGSSHHRLQPGAVVPADALAGDHHWRRGVELSVIFPYWLITVLTIILFIGTSSRSMFKGIQMWKQETLLKVKYIHSPSFLLLMDNVDSNCEPLLPQPERSTVEILMFNIRWKRIMVLMVVWFSFLLLQILKTNSKTCSLLYWTVNILQFPVALSVFGWEASKLWRESRERRMQGNWECVCEASIEWTVTQLVLCALCGVVGGTVGGLLGSGGGFVLGPLLLEIGVLPQVASATATFVMMFSSSLSVVEFYFLKRFPIPYDSMSVFAGFGGQFFVRKLVKFLGRESIIVFILSSVIFASALTMRVVGIGTSISMIKNHEYMGFLSLCEN